MSQIIEVLFALNIIVCLVNLGFYAWGGHHPESLASGIACAFAALLLKEL